jgi:hypothetical protein
MAFYRLRLLVQRKPARFFDGVVLILVTLSALFCGYELEIFPTDSKPYTLELDELLLVSTIFFGGLFLCALRWFREQRSSGQINAFGMGLECGRTVLGRPSKNAEIWAAIDALVADGIDLSKVPRKDAYLRVREKAVRLGANVEIGFSEPVIRRMLLRRYGPRG